MIWNAVCLIAILFYLLGVTAYLDHRLRRAERVVVALSNTIAKNEKTHADDMETIRLRLSAAVQEPEPERPKAWTERRRELEVQYSKKAEGKNAS